MHRIVHLDLKGAPLNVPYMEKILQLIKQWGATGILLEWEDTFPYTSQLMEIGSLGASGGSLYTISEVKYIMQYAKQIGLEPIQLVQTMGHMEFVLKHPTFRGLRESPRSPASLCPSKPESQALVRAMLEQVLSAQPDASYLHIGADEVWQTGICPDCHRRGATAQARTATLYLEHIRDLALHLKMKRPNLTILMWDDMLRSMTFDNLKAYNLGELVEPVVWHYNPGESFHIEPCLWSNYKQLFPKVWAGSAFKGANGSCQVGKKSNRYLYFVLSPTDFEKFLKEVPDSQYVATKLISPPARYISNHQAWVREIQKYSEDIDFAGIVLTGWSRYDHYATMCELLPVALPTLASCLKVLNNPTTEFFDVISADQVWPGSDVMRGVLIWYSLKQKCLALLRSDMVATWLNPWQLQNHYTNPMQIEGLGVTAQQFQNEVAELQTELIREVGVITDSRNVSEWIQSELTPVLRQLTELRRTVELRCLHDAGVHACCKPD